MFPNINFIFTKVHIDNVYDQEYKTTSCSIHVFDGTYCRPSAHDVADDDVCRDKVDTVIFYIIYIYLPHCTYCRRLEYIDEWGRDMITTGIFVENI